MFREETKSLTAAVVVVAAGLVVTGCTAAAPVASSSSSPLSPPPSVSTSAMTAPARSVPAPTGLTQQQLYHMAVLRYTAYFHQVTGLDAAGGAPTFPGIMHQYVMEPARSALEKAYRDLHASGEKYVGTPHYELQRVAADDNPDPPTGTVVAIKVCELAQGAPSLRPDGTIVQDDSPVIQYRRVYFKFDPTDGQLKAFIINGNTVGACPFNWDRSDLGRSTQSLH